MKCIICQKEILIDKELFCERDGDSYHSICYYFAKKKMKKQTFDEVLLDDNQMLVRELLNNFVPDDIKNDILTEFNIRGGLIYAK